MNSIATLLGLNNSSSLEDKTVETYCNKKTMNQLKEYIGNLNKLMINIETLINIIG